MPENERKIIIEVGGNRGQHTEKFVSNKDNIVYTFEPNHDLLVTHLWPLAKLNQNLCIIPFAVDIKNSFRNFNIANDDGASSFYTFNSQGVEAWPKHPNNDPYHNFKYIDQYIVPTITLYHFCELYSIEYIDYLHIDAQGNDYKVLKSLKDKISIVKEGHIETDGSVQLYSETDNSFETIERFLLDHDFKIVESINSQQCDVKFIRTTSYANS